MSEAPAEATSIFRSIRIALVVSGAVALIAGLVLLIWPLKSAIIVTGIFAAYLILAGLVYLGLGIFAQAKRGWSRLGHLALGLLYIAAGVIAFANLGAATRTLAVVTVIFIGLSWIVDGIVSLSLLGSDGSRVWTLVYALLGVIAGAAVLLSPLYAAVVLWWVLSIALIVLGLGQLVRGFTFGRQAGVTI